MQLRTKKTVLFHFTLTSKGSKTMKDASQYSEHTVITNTHSGSLMIDGDCELMLIEGSWHQDEKNVSFHAERFLFLEILSCLNYFMS